MPSALAALAALERLRPDERAALLADLPPQMRAAVDKELTYNWRLRARPEQLEPGSEGAADRRTNWRTWIVLSGRGWGKTRSGVEWVRERVNNGARRLILCGPTAADVRDVLIEGESGLLAIYPPNEAPLYEPSKRRVTWKNGATAVLLSAEEPERFRGIQGDTVLADELCAWERPEAWELLQFSMRLGQPRLMVTTTPKPTKLLREIIADPSTVITRGSTFDNAANLAPEFLIAIRDKYEGTRLGRQELYAEVLLDTPGALWNTTMLEACRVKSAPALRRVVTAVDPAVTSHSASDETGIISAGVAMCACKGLPEMHGFVLADSSGRFTPAGWANAVITQHRRLNGDRVVAEVNQGGDMIEKNLRTVEPNLSYRAINARQGKRTRAEPIAALYEQNRVHHCGDLFKLEAEQCQWDPLNPNAKSPNRIDALVHCLTELMLGGGAPSFSFPRGALSMRGGYEEDQ